MFSHRTFNYMPQMTKQPDRQRETVIKPFYQPVLRKQPAMLNMQLIYYKSKSHCSSCN